LALEVLENGIVLPFLFSLVDLHDAGAPYFLRVKFNQRQM